MIDVEKMILNKIKKIIEEDPEKLFSFINKEINKNINFENVLDELFFVKNRHYKDKINYNISSHSLRQKKILLEFINNEKRLYKFKDIFIKNFPIGTFLTWDENNSNEVVFKIFYNEKEKTADFGGKIVALKDIPLNSLVELENSVKIYA